MWLYERWAKQCCFHADRLRHRHSKWHCIDIKQGIEILTHFDCNSGTGVGLGQCERPPKRRKTRTTLHAPPFLVLRAFLIFYKWSKTYCYQKIINTAFSSSTINTVVPRFTEKMPLFSCHWEAWCIWSCQREILRQGAGRGPHLVQNFVIFWTFQAKIFLKWSHTNKTHSCL